ncbi:MAG: hypothetical protein IPL27_05300 [Lewinellaceae bacterium]|nr:hypothetical protein [Lewinellaceae bacterium]
MMQDTFYALSAPCPISRAGSKFNTWLHKIAVSLAVNRLRIKRYMSWQSLEDAPVKAVDAYSDFTTSEKQETYKPVAGRHPSVESAGCHRPRVVLPP